VIGLFLGCGLAICHDLLMFWSKSKKIVKNNTSDVSIADAPPADNYVIVANDYPSDLVQPLNEIARFKNIITNENMQDIDGIMIYIS
jgi:hypothetical protein